jgi:cytochrome c2
MSFRGFSKPEDIANVVAYLRSLSGSPAPLPQ